MQSVFRSRTVAARLNSKPTLDSFVTKTSLYITNLNKQLFTPILWLSVLPLDIVKDVFFTFDW